MANVWNVVSEIEGFFKKATRIEKQLDKGAESLAVLADIVKDVGDKDLQQAYKDCVELVSDVRAIFQKSSVTDSKPPEQPEQVDTGKQTETKK